jgi:hypothetical protein
MNQPQKPPLTKQKLLLIMTLRDLAGTPSDPPAVLLAAQRSLVTIDGYEKSQGWPWGSAGNQ